SRKREGAAVKWVVSTWRFLAGLGLLFVALMGGIGSLVLAIVAAARAAKWDDMSFWLGSYVCLGVAAFAFWYREHSKVVKVNGLTVARSETARNQLAVLNEG